MTKLEQNWVSITGEVDHRVVFYGLKIPNVNIAKRVASLESGNLKDARQKLTSLEDKYSTLHQLVYSFRTIV